ncbi:ABC transporter substrate-binding protein [Desulfobacterota bacterium AH_259_B03_O07]|nr:ABC transporter substrate-binding protein [Desulfobacterota bacterium AH_259_B03_O07]
MKTRLIMSRILFSVLIFLVSTSPSKSGKYPERIISLSPNITEIIYGIGAWEKVVGVTLYSDFPPEAEGVPKVGGWVNPNFEEIVKLNPDLVLLMKDQDGMFGDKIRKLGYKTLTIDSNTSINDIQNSILEIGRMLGKQDEAHRLSEEIKNSLNEIRLETENTPDKKVLLVIARNPGRLEDIYVIGKNNYINELISLAGGTNVVESDRFALKITIEAILSYSPDVIIEVNHQKNKHTDDIVKIWNDLKETQAVKDQEVHVVLSNELLRPSQRIIEGARILSRILHPELSFKNEKHN